MFDDLEGQAKSIDAAFQRDMSALAKRTDLTQQGRAEGAQYLEAVRRTAVQRLQDEARQRHQAAAEAAQAAQRAQRAADVERRREVLGDTILLRLYERRIDNADADELRQMVADAADGYERLLVEELARITLGERLSMPNATRTDFEVWQALQPPADADYELRSAGQRISQLDLAGYRASMADRLSIDAKFVPDPF